MLKITKQSITQPQQYGLMNNKDSKNHNIANTTCNKNHKYMQHES